MMTAEEVAALEPSTYKDYCLRELSMHWRCVLCREELVLRVPAVIGNVCCPGCGMSCLRPIHDVWCSRCTPDRSRGDAVAAA